MKKISTRRGFTLIELLVVIAIIGILSSVVLVSLNSARSKGKGASAQESMVSMRSAAELVNTNGNYPDTLCTVALANLMNAVASSSGATPVCGVNPTTNPTAWAVSVDMTGAGGTAGTQTANFCVDSTGFAGGRQTTVSVATSSCPAI